MPLPLSRSRLMDCVRSALESRILSATDQADAADAMASLVRVVDQLGSGHSYIVDDIAGGTAHDPGAAQAPAADAAADAAQLTRYLQARFSDEPDIRAEQVRSIAGGHSKQTTRLTIVSSAGGSRDAVFRQDGAVALTGSSVCDEYPFLRVLHESGFPVPKPLWVDPDPGVFTTPLLATEFVPGAVWGDNAGPRPGFEGDISVILGRLISRLHEVPVTALDPEPDREEISPEVIARQLAYWRGRYDTEGDAPDPRLAAALAWLESNAHLAIDRKVIVHGDFGFHNFLFDGWEVVSVVDWETAHLGSAAEDIARAGDSCGGSEGKQRLLDAYQAASGRTIEPGTLKFYNLLRLVRSSIIGRSAMFGFNRGATNSIRLVASCLYYYDLNVDRIEECMEAG